MIEPSGDVPDREWMGQALALAALGKGTTSPNPCVGCVLVSRGRVVGQGYHRAAGEPHAEALAASEAGPLARGATAYVNLEPCSHVGRTPPCTELLVRCGIGRLVVATTDPNPLVNGRGIRELREAGIEVVVGPLEREARRVNAPFLHYHWAGRPLVTLKAAVTADGMLSAREGRSRWITGPAARLFAHRLRLEHDAILVGAGTVRRDAPALGVRIPGVRAPRLRVVLAPRLGLDPRAPLFEPAEDGACPRPRVYVARGAPSDAVAPLEARADVVPVSAGDAGLDLSEVLSDLARIGVLSVLVEGGGRTLASFLRAGLADRAAMFCAPILLGARGGTPMLDLPSAEDPAAGFRIEIDERFALGEDLFVAGRIRARS